MANAQRLLGRLGQIGIGLAVAGGVAQSALYNGEHLIFLRRPSQMFLSNNAHFQWTVVSERLSSTASQE